ncbi:MarR family winged helix-turn-helix transcriptional regulator [Desulfofalx alkaliphila]|uniref:MarR family winged helix-turn-helix transcriptional regulator n=1 Tax=Desulfofalx alkaliphila TaxID=105483 RepID=UPI00068C71D4|nr:MarR family transcriptional regulator [Desulfofalx alkaliphila]
MQDAKDLVTMHTLLNLIRGLYKAVDEDWRNSATKTGLTVSQHHLLWILHFENGATLSQISDYGIWHLSTVMDLVERMEKAGLVRKEVDTNDARTKRVFITEKGEKILHSSIQHVSTFRFFKFLKEDKGNNIEQHINLLYNLNKTFHGDSFVNYVKQSSSKLENEIIN